MELESIEVEVRKKEKAKSFDTALSIRADWRLVRWGALAIACCAEASASHQKGTAPK